MCITLCRSFIPRIGRTQIKLPVAIKKFNYSNICRHVYFYLLCWSTFIFRIKEETLAKLILVFCTFHPLELRYLFLFLWCSSSNRAQASSFFRFLEHTQLHTQTLTVSRLLWKSDQLVVEASTYTTHYKYKRLTSVPSAGLEPVIPAVEQPQTYALDHMTL